MNVTIESSWQHALHQEFEKPYFKDLVAFLKEQKSLGKRIYPPGKQLFNAFNLCPLHQVKVVIMGQDPYHGPGQAHGLSFSVNEGIPLPPSLQNIYKEIENDIGTKMPASGNLERWATQGVLLLNAVLSVEAHQAGSHQGKGWETFTDAVIQLINTQCDGVVFLLWGSYAKNKSRFIDSQKHGILSCGHPSPLSANRGLWFGNTHFSKANTYLMQHGKTPIIW